jgi:sulfide:quinone oxidoreductase
MCRVAGSLLGAPYNCPPAPYETAFLLDEYLRGRGVRYAIELVVSTPLPMTLPAAGPGNSQFVAEALKDWVIELLTGQRIQAIDVDTRIEYSTGGEEEWWV